MPYLDLNSSFNFSNSILFSKKHTASIYNQNNCVTILISQKNIESDVDMVQKKLKKQHDFFYYRVS